MSSLEESYRPLVDDLATEAFCFLTTRGRVTGRPHEIEIWFAMRGSTVYMLAGGGRKSDWVKNLLAHPSGQVRIREETYPGEARLVDDPDEDAWARKALLDKYNKNYAGDLTDWSRTALPVAVDLSAGTDPEPLRTTAEPS
jgi:deazaflavin-dependent oxidoreductase (nitroreductase family)